ncbi:MAG: C4-type zinc ribbon domain-containing protein, partial [Thermoanaerobaculia bacterium]
EHQGHALAALERQESEQERMSEAELAFDEVDARYQVELAKWETQKPLVSREAEVLGGRLEVLRAQLPRPLLAQFDSICRRYGGQALAAARRVDRAGRGQEMWHCSACNYRVRPQAIVEIRNLGAVVACDSCKRILYLPEGDG